MKEIFQLVMAAFLWASSARAQEATSLVRVHVDCAECDDSYVREQLNFVDLVRDRRLADVGVLVTFLPTGAGGRAASIELIPLRAQLVRGDTVAVTIAPDATESEARQVLVRSLKLALLPFVRHSSARAFLDVVYAPPAQQATVARGAQDRWNLWVFRLSGSGSLSGDDNYSARWADGEVNASRVTEALKVQLTAKGGYNRERYRLSDDESLLSIRRSWSARSLVALSLDDHFSLGLSATALSSEYQNLARQLRVMPAIEYDVFPYREATQRQLVARYSAGVRASHYVDSTIFRLIGETRPIHELTVVSDIRQPWGNVWGGAMASQYLHDLSKRRLTVDAGVDWRIVAGLSFNFSVNYSLIRDQLNIPGANLSNEERLLKLRELQSGSSASAGVGLSYTFGSVFSNVVNPRFRL